MPPRRMPLDRRTFFAGAALGVVASGLPASAGPAPAMRATRVPAPSPPDGGVSGVIATHAAKASYGDIDPTSLERAKLRLLDLVGCAIGGTRGEGQKPYARSIGARAGRPDATILGTGIKAPASEAAMANATLARAFDFEVMHVVVNDRQVPSHHAPTTVMTALAMAERMHGDGKSFLAALSVGDDLAARTLAAAGIDFGDGWDGVPLHATLAATVIASRFLGLDPLATRHAIGLATDQIGGTVQSIWDGGNAWKMVQGAAARNGVVSAELAQAGWTGMEDPLLGPCGLYAQFTPGCSRPDLLTADLGHSWFAETYFKPYPSCAANHPTIECALTLRDRVRLDPRDIVSVRLMLAPGVLNLFIAKPLRDGPSRHSQANFNVRFACANALLRGDFCQEHYDPVLLAEPALKTLISRISLERLPAGTQGVSIEVTTVDGRRLEESLSGHPRHYADMAGTSAKDVAAKFHKQVAFAGNVSADLAEEIVRRIASVDKEADMSRFVALLAPAITFHDGAG